jgi:hypothetical protein
MKKIFLILLVCLSTGVSAQKFWQMPMDVQAVEFDDFYCHKDVSVIWGTRNDTIAFAFNNRLLLYSLDVSLNEVSRVKRYQIDKYIKENKYSVLTIDNRGELYMITFRADENTGQILISVGNIDYGVPTYLFSFGTNICE